MSELPKGWVSSNFGFIVSKLFTGLVRSASEQGADKEYKYLKMNNLSVSGQFLFEDITRVNATKSEVKKMSLETGDFIFNTRNSVDLVGKCGVFKEQLNEPVLFNNNLLKVRFFSVIPEYVCYWMNSPKGKENLRQITSATTSVAAIYQKNLMNTDINLAPLAEQKRIVEKLDQVLAQVDTIKARLDGIPAILKRFRQSVLAAAVSGKLTEEFRKKHNLIRSWDDLKIGSLVSRIEAGKNIRCIERPPESDEVGIVKISAVTWGKFNEFESKTLSDRDLFIENRRIQKGDFLISRANTIELLGNPVIVSSIEKNLMLSDKVLRLVMDSDDKPWVSIFLRSIFGRKEIESRSTGNQMSMRNIGQKALLDIDIPKPSREEQTEIVRLVDQYFAFADTIEAQVQKAQQRVDKLTQSILAKAFRGELVPQDPNDEPADELLKRIATARAESEALAKAAKKITKKTTKKA